MKPRRIIRTLDDTLHDYGGAAAYAVDGAIAEVRNNHPVPGAATVLAELRRRGYSIAVVGEGPHDAQQCLMIGDSLEDDIVSALQAGMAAGYYQPADYSMRVA